MQAVAFPKSCKDSLHRNEKEFSIEQGKAMSKFFYDVIF